jgi:hypothetical protein
MDVQGEARLIAFLKEMLSIRTEHVDGRIQISLFWGDEKFSSDFIDYSDVVRIVERENKETAH